MGNLKTKWGKRIAVVMAFALTVVSVPGADAQAAKKKATLAKKKLTIKVGKKKTIKIKNKAKKAKYTFKSKKASIANVSKKGVVTAKKAGSTSITVKEKLGKKTRKLGNVKVTVKGSTVNQKQPTTPTAPATPAAPTASATGQAGVTNPTDVPLVTDEPTVPTAQATRSPRPVTPKPPTPTPTVKPTPTADPYTPKGKGWQKLDLSQWSGSSENYLETGGQIVLSKVDLVTVPIPTNLENIGDKIEVLIRGSVPTGSNGFRYWLSNNGTATMTTMGHYSNFGEGVEDPRKELEKDEEGNTKDPKEDLDVEAFKAGDFEVQRVLEHINKDGSDDIIATKMLLKGPSYGSNLDGITITGIWVRYGDDIGKEEDPIVTPPVDTSTVESPSVTDPGGEDPGPGEEDPGVPWTTVDLSMADQGTFDSAAGTLAVKGVDALAFTLPSNLPADGKLEVKLEGTDNGGSLFRVWAGGYQNNRTSDVALHPGMFGTFVTDGTGGDFSIICNLTMGEGKGDIYAETNKLSLKGYASWNAEAITASGKMDDIVFTSVSYRIVDEFSNK